ncbi:ABC transporter substrate-binding protein [Sphingomonas sp. BN140010]|uniref:ABC transporter substrate-binding protein n=1 Tax=Sphingomonas arvum TaxID=2992113 RepID=A0ABT3JGM1_9SPHN|nr:ABC transporter substrate-binding protein [Sphingomonas sp. BN140010]MCW3798234.1 ABC transporter substrate-binding protein [Sphingomonas sp. BN140010]
MNARRLVLLAAALLAAGCRKQEEGAVRVTVIGEPPAIVDPAAAPLTEPQAVLLANTAQGLVRFDAAGNIVAGLAERWNVSDDGLSYIFRLQTGTWPSGRKISAQDVARLLRRQTARASRNPVKDTVGAIKQIVAMTDRVLAIELSAPRPNLLQLLAQPEFALVRSGQGTGPFIATPSGDGLRLVRELPVGEEEQPRRETVQLTAANVEAAVRAFAGDRTDLVLGGRFSDLGVALGTRLPRGVLRFDPASGLFGLVPARATGPAADKAVRVLLDQALDRDALVAALGVADLVARASILEPGLDGGLPPAVPPWTAQPLADRQAALSAEAARLLPREEGQPQPTIRVVLPEGPGAAILLQRLRTDWGALGLAVELAGKGAPADFRLLDQVAPSTSPAWFLRTFRCDAVPVCSAPADERLEAARATLDPRQRAQFLFEAERLMRDDVLFLPLSAPVRWSLNRNLPGFVENRFARHSLIDLRNRPE